MTGAGETVVRENALVRDGLFAALTAVFLLALGRGLIGASTTAGRIAVGIIFGALAVATLIGWLLVRRRRRWLEISPDAIVLRTNGHDAAVTLARTAGAELQFVQLGSGRSSHLGLTTRGGEIVLSLPFFAKKQIRAAGTANGWAWS